MHAEKNDCYSEPLEHGPEEQAGVVIQSRQRQGDRHRHDERGECVRSSSLAEQAEDERQQKKNSEKNHEWKKDLSARLAS